MSLLDRATPAQVTAVNTQFWYLGYRRADREQRLAVCAALLGLDELATTKDLTAGQAGQLVRLLAQHRARGGLEAAIAPARGVAAQPARLDAGAFAFVLAFALCAGTWRPAGPVTC